MDKYTNHKKLKLLSTGDVIKIATDAGIWIDNPEMNQSIPAQRLKTRLKKFADRIQLLTAEQFEDRIPDID